MTKWLLIPICAICLKAQPAPLDAETVRTAFRFPRALEATEENPFKVPETFQEKVVWERHFLPAAKGSVISIDIYLMRSPALLTPGKLDQMDQVERQMTESLEPVRKQLAPEELEKYDARLRADSPMTHLNDGRRVAVGILPGQDDSGGLISLIFPTADGKYEFFAQVVMGGSSAAKADPDPKLWKNYDWIPNSSERLWGSMRSSAARSSNLSKKSPSDSAQIFHDVEMPVPAKNR